MENANVLATGVSGAVGLNTKMPGHPFRIVPDLNGSRALSFVPVGRTTSVTASFL
jgi:inner membrane protein involved in colicin E2 resistance